MLGKAFVMVTVTVEGYDSRGNLVDMTLGGWSTGDPVESLHELLVAVRGSLGDRWSQAEPAAIRAHLNAVQRPAVWEQLDLFS